MAWVDSLFSRYFACAKLNLIAMFVLSAKLNLIVQFNFESLPAKLKRMNRVFNRISIHVKHDDKGVIGWCLLVSVFFGVNRQFLSLVKSRVFH